jgi:hypothetical protein
MRKKIVALSDGTEVYIDMDGDLQLHSERSIYIEKKAIPELLQFLMGLNLTDEKVHR